MSFRLRPILSEIKELYSKPRTPQRFKEYLAMLQGNTQDDMSLPIVGFNPMAKEHILDKIKELEALQAEELITEVLREINLTTAGKTSDTITVVLNVADDLMGVWTNRYTTDYDSKFKLSAFIERKFCVPHFWTSESYSAELIKSRTRTYAYRMLYLLNHPMPMTLQDHVNQEAYVARKANLNSDIDESAYKILDRFYQQHRDSDDHSLIFNFFYGDDASDSLGYRTYGISGATGFDYVADIQDQ